MRLLLVRHGAAAPLGDGIPRDADRPLTATGLGRMRRAAAGLAEVAPRPRAVLSSPLLRARQTADILARAWGKRRSQCVAALATGEEASLRQVLADFAEDDTVVLVGHETWLSELTARLLGSEDATSFRFRKGGIALIDTKSAKLERGALLWFIPPKILRALG